MGKVTVGALTGGYEATRFKEDAKPSPLASVEVLGLADEAAASAAVSTGTALAAGTMMARCDPGVVRVRVRVWVRVRPGIGTTQNML